jgi:hypothetical protein
MPCHSVQTSLAAAEERHVDSEAQLVEAEAALSRQQGLVRQVRTEGCRREDPPWRCRDYGITSEQAMRFRGASRIPFRGWMRSR